MFGRIAALAAGRRSKWAVIGAWVALAAAMTPFYGDLQREADDESETFQVRGADSTLVDQLLTDRFRTGGDSTAIVVYESGGESIYAFDLPISDDIERLCRGDLTADLRGVGGPAGTACGELGGDALPETPPPSISEDERAVLVTVVSEDDSTPVVVGDVEALREFLPDPDDADLRALVTGAAGFEADRSEALKGIDETLLAITAALVLALLLLTFRSPLIAAVPLAVVIVAYLVAAGATWGLFALGLTTVSGQTTAFLIVLMFGAGTDYCLLIVSRYREELCRSADTHAAMVAAAERTGPAIMSAGGTVVAAMLVLTLADFNATREMGPILALGIALMMVAGLTLLPAVLVAVGRRAFWPAIPAVGDEARRGGAWRRIGGLVRRRPVLTAAAVGALLAAGALGNLDRRGHLDFTEDFRAAPESVRGHEVVSARFEPGRAAPLELLASPDVALDALTAVQEVDAVDEAYAHSSSLDGELISHQGLLGIDPFSEQAIDLIPTLREKIDGASGDELALLGGITAEAYDIREALGLDARLIVPLVLALIFVILVVLLRSVIAPLYVIATVALSYAFALGASSLFFTHVLGQPDSHPSLPTFAFIFLVALGVDYNIFLLTRVREERRSLPIPDAVVAGLERTGRVITSAGLVLAGTFAALMALGLESLFQIGFVVALGLLVDTFLVRSMLVPAIAVILGDRGWWPWGAPGTPESVSPAGAERPA